MPPQQPGQSLPHPEPTHNKRKKLTGIVVLVLLVVLAALFLLPFSPLSLLKSGIAKGPRMMVGNLNPFIYACGVFDVNTVGKELGLNQDKSKQGVEESFSFDPSDSRQRTVDLIKLTGESSVNSSCKIKFDRAMTAGPDGTQTPSFINVSLFVEQFATEREASEKFAIGKGGAGDGVKTLASYVDTSYYIVPTAAPSGPTYVQPVVKHRNLLIYYTAPLKEGDTSAAKMTVQLDALTKDVLKRIDAKEGEKPKNFSATTKIGNNKFVDSCQSVDYAKFGKALGGDIQYEPTSFVGSQYYGTDDGQGKSPKHLLSVCTFDFRTKAEADIIAAEQREDKPRDDKENPYKSHYPHFALVQILTTENKEAAQKIISDFKKSGESQQAAGAGAPKIEDVKLGDAAIKVSIAHSQADPYDNQLYYIAKDARTYLISVSYKRQSQPFKTTDQGVSDAQAQKLLDVLTAGAAHAQKQ